AAPAAPVAAPLPSPAGLGMTDLASRLAESMARRRAARAGAAAPEAPAASAPAAAFEPAPPPPAFAPAPVEAPAPIPAAFTPAETPAPETFAAPFAAPQPAMPAAFAPPSVEAAVPPAVQPPIPVAFEAPQPLPAVPSAMRPLDLGGFEEEEAPLDSLLPPRLNAAAPAPQPAPVMPAVPDEAELAAQGVQEDNYASLLGIGAFAPRGGPVRIDEPELEQAATEPVVIFPGQAPRPVEAPAMADPNGGFRRFDAPASAGQGQPIAANQAAPSVAPDEAEQALRAALANLQRMSGAA
ncbi:MAG TPA: hypothetical protein VFV30_09940, partial [Novosphingobium sp.]|nr:hypothetical protein [Novosphingobium sp.]